MAKVVRVSQGDYKVIVQNGGTITLDPTNGQSDESGLVLVKGDLEVRGDTTTVSSSTMTVEDNIITLNQGQQGSGISASLDYRSGFEIDRGSLTTARVVFDEQISWANGGDSGIGTFTFEAGSTTLPIKTSGIVAGGTLYVQTGAGVISVTGSTNYEESVYTYDSGVITDSGGGVIIDDDNIPNAKAVADYVNYIFSADLQPGIEDEDTSVVASDFDNNSVESKITVSIDGNTTAEFFSNRTVLNDVQILDNEISSLTSNSDLILSASGTGNVRIEDNLNITNTPHNDDVATDPSVPTENSTTIYTKAEAGGNTGIYYVNSNETRDELISRNRALVFSMLW